MLVVVFIIVFSLSVFIFYLAILLMVAFLVLLERKVLSLLQIRKSPNLVSIFGLLQTILDSVKLLIKKYLVNVFNFFFFLAPVFFFLLSLLQWLVMPLQEQYFQLMYSILITFILSGLMVYILVWTGWGSSSSFGFISTIRGIAQMISYEVVFFFFLMMFMYYYSYSSWHLFIYNVSWYSFLFNMFFLTPWILLVLMELNRAPFDLVEGESELVSGFNVEYSGYGFTLLFLAEYMNIWLLSLLTALIFFSASFNFIIFILIVVLAIVWVRGLLPRFKFLDIIFLTWKIYLPIILMLLFMFFSII